MTIHELLALTGLTESDEIPVWDAEASGESTKKITAQNMTASVKALGSLVNASEMNNALAGKQNTLTFDTTPTTGSTNPVTSGGVADAIQQSTAYVKENSFLGPTGRCFTIESNTYNNNVDSIVDAIHAYYPGGGYFSADIVGNLTNPQTNVNRNFIYGFFNSSNSFGWVIIESFGKRFRGNRQGASTFTFTQI